MFGFVINVELSIIVTNETIIIIDKTPRLSIHNLV